MRTLEWAFVLGAAFLLLLRLLLFHRKSGKNFPPSPPAFPFIGHLHLLRDPRNLSIDSLYKKPYGPIVFLRLGSRPVLIVSSPELVEEILSKKDAIFANHPNIYVNKVLGYNSASMFFTTFSPFFVSLRRFMALEVVSTSHHNVLSVIQNQELHLIVRQMLKASPDRDGKREVVFNGLLFELIYSSLYKIVNGQRDAGEEAAKEDMEGAKEFKAIFDELLRLFFRPNPRDFFPWLGWADLAGVEKRIWRLKPRMDRFVDKLIDEHRLKRKSMAPSPVVSEDDPRLESMEDRSIIGLLLKMQDTDPQTFTDDAIKAMILIIFMGGTTPPTEIIESTMHVLLSHSEIMGKVRDEIDATVGTGRIIDESDSSQLKYLRCVIKEVLRLHVTVGGSPPHESSKDCTIQGYHVPAGTMVFLNLWRLQRDPKHWDDPMAFKPERFINQNEERLGYKYVPFSAGRRRCPGEFLGMRLMMYVVGLLIQCFDWNHMTAEEVDLSGLLGFTPPRSHPVVAKFKVRDSMINIIEKYYL